MVSRHELYNERLVIEDKEKQLIHIPVYNRYKKLVGHAISNLRFKDLLLEYCYHLIGKKKYVFSNNNISMHELVMGKKAPKGYIIDHINGNPLDNRIENLRYILFDLNSQSKPKKLNCSSQYIGVNFNKRENKWKSNIRKNGKLIALGT